MAPRDFTSYIADLLEHEDIQDLRRTNAHWRRDRFAHNLAVGKLAFHLTRLVNGNLTVAARGGFLHDWYHGHVPGRKPFVQPDQHHFRIAHEAAAKYGEHPLVLHVIRTHFWPYGRVMPKTREAWMVWMADNLVWVADLVHSVKMTLRDGLHQAIYGEVRA